MNNAQKAFSLLHKLKHSVTNKEQFSQMATEETVLSLVFLAEQVLYDIADESVCVDPTHAEEKKECEAVLQKLARAYDKVSTL